MDTISNISAILSIAGFFITIITLLITLNIRTRIKSAADKQQFLKERDAIASMLKEVNSKLWKAPDGEKLDIIAELHSVLEQIITYKIWNSEDFWAIYNLRDITVKLLNEKKKIDPSLHVEIDKLITIINTESKFI